MAARKRRAISLLAGAALVAFGLVGVTSLNVGAFNPQPDPPGRFGVVGIMQRRLVRRWIRGSATVVVALVGTLLMTLAALAAPGTLLWESQVEGSLLWESQVDKSGGGDLAWAVAVDGGRVFAAGQVASDGSCLAIGTGNCDFYVRAYDGATGAVLWEDEVDKTGGADRAWGVTARGGRVFASGNVAGDASCNLNTGTGNCDFYVRAYEAATGAVLWEDRLDQAGGMDFSFAPPAVVGPRVVVSGTVTNSAGNFDYLVRTYDAATGSLLWEEEVDKAGGADSANAVAAQGSRLFAAGQVDADGSCDFLTFTGNCDFYVRAYDIVTGAVLWENQFDVAGGYDTASPILASALGLEGGRVFAAGEGTSFDGDLDFLVRAYDARTGAALWTDQFDLAGGGDRAFDLASQAGRVFAAGRGIGAGGTEDLLVRGYDAHTGGLLWMDQFDSAGQDFDLAQALVAEGGQVVAAGASGGVGGADFLVRAYDAQTGGLRWMDQFDKAGGFDFASGLAVHGARIFAVGRGTNAAGNSDFLVRAYEAR